ncbi:hypothetical protein LPJ56_005403 [Coemansia sp. RSA 2599]|nr:hypothetical protein LPJ56_005403 [Coemansia sp. RSA 2599]
MVLDKQAESVLATVSSSWCNGATEALFVSRIEREVGLHGRIAYIVKVDWSGLEAILKLTWSATNRMPENAIYDILASSGVQRIPRVHSCGLLIKDFRGYRLDYLVMEDCGVPLSKALETLKPRERSFVGHIRRIIDDVTSCLVDAFVAGVLHRDISDGNIAVKIDDNEVSARIIDWEYAKDTKWDSSASRDAGFKWYYDSERVGKNEEAHDPITGTPRYMSITTLEGIQYRNVITDIESFFYVVLDALRGIYPTNPSKTPDGFSFQKRLSLLGHARIVCLARPNKWLADFGVDRSKLPSGLLDILEAMRRFLFFDDGKYIGLDLVLTSPYIYSVDEASAKVFMSEDTIAFLTSRASSTAVKVSEVMPRFSPIKRTSIAVGGNVADTQHSPTVPRKRKATEAE